MQINQNFQKNEEMMLSNLPTYSSNYGNIENLMYWQRKHGIEMYLKTIISSNTHK